MDNAFSPFSLPIFLNTSDMLAVVVGGGPVGRRKARTLLTAGAAVRLVALEPRPDDFRHERLDWLTEPYRRDHIDGAKLVFTAAPSAVCERIQADARSRGMLVCRADDAAAGDFITPASIVRGDMRIAISTGGSSPALARRIRRRLEAMFDEPFAAWVDLLAGWRRTANQGPWSLPSGRDTFLKRITEWSWLTMFRRAGGEKVAQAYLALATQLGFGGRPE